MQPSFGQSMGIREIFEQEKAKSYEQLYFHCGLTIKTD